MKALHEFEGANGGPAEPTGALVPGGGAILYGTTYMGGAANRGTIYELTLK
jgi:uncharacterized repeat protein (TIGR03803 family)